MLSALLALPASAQKITTQHEVVDCGQVVFHKPVTAEDEHCCRRKFRHQGGIRCQADGYFHQAGLPLYQCG